MVQRVTSEDGSIHEFPDDASPQEMNSALDQMEKQSKIERFQKVTGINQPPGFGQNMAAGMLHGITEVAKNIPDLGTMVPQSMQGAIPYQAGQRPIDKFDAYKAMGTTDEPITTMSGLAQTLGELYAPGKAAAKGYEIAKPAIKAGMAKAGELLQPATDEVKSLGSKVADYFSAGKERDKFLRDLGQGATNQEEASTSLGRKIREAHNAREEEAGAYFKHPLARAGEEEIYKKPDPLITTAMDENKALLNKMEDLNIGDLYEAYKAKPTFNNAHKLQSELGVMIGDLSKNPYKTIAEGQEIEKIKNIRDQLKGGINKFLENRDLNSNETLAPMYKRASDLYREHVVPYLSSRKLREIVRGGKETVDNIHSIFKSPSNIINRVTGKSEIGPVNKILQDLPQEAQNEILFSRIGGMSNLGNTEKLADSIANAENRGYSKYVTPQLKDRLQEVIAKQRNQNLLKKVGGGIVGGGLAVELAKHILGNRG